MTEIQKADPDARRKAATILLVATGLALAALSALIAREEQLRRWLEANVEWLAGNPWLVFLAALIAMIPLVAMAAYLFVFGARIVRAGRFPLPGQAVTRDTPVLTGARAASRGRVIQALSLVLIACGLAIPVTLWYLFATLARAS